MASSSSFLICFILFASFALSLIHAQVQCPTAPSTPGDRRTDQTKLTVATFNAEWLFLSRSNCPGSGCSWPDLPTAKVHLNNIASVIAEMNTDIIVIPETENCLVLIELLATTQLSSKGYKPYLVTGTDTATGQNVGLITRVDPTTNLVRTSARYEFPVSGSQCGYKGSSGTSAVSKHFYTRFDVKGLSKPLLLVGLHFVAFPLQADRCAQREAQASVVRDIVTMEGLAKDYHVIVAGDFNDHDPTIVDEAGSVPISKVFDIIKGNELDNAMIRHSGYKTGAGIYSGWWDKNSNCRDDKGGEHTLIDHLLFSKSLPLRSVRFYHSFTASCESIMSDHWPIIIDITTVSATEEVAITTIQEGGDQIATAEAIPQIETAEANNNNVNNNNEGIEKWIVWVGVGGVAGIGVVSVGIAMAVVFLKKRRNVSKQEEGYLLA